MRIAIVAAAALFAMPAIAAPDSDPKAESEEASAESNEDEKVCRNVSQTGSRKKERVCKTRKEWIKFNRGE